MKEKIIVIGSGAWGSAIANLIAKNDFAKNFNICLISNSQEISREINENHSNNKFLPQVKLQNNLKSSIDLDFEIQDANYVFIVVPSGSFDDLINKIATLKIKENCGFIICTKGLDHQNLKFFHQIIEEKFDTKNYAILSGPNFAIEVANLYPSITTIAAKNQNFAQKIINLLKNENFKPEFSPNILTTEICGIVKNIMAIGCGIVDGLDLGQNAKAALLMQGIFEIKLLCKKFESSEEISNAAGFGDIFLTCASTKSRNNSLGFNIGKGAKPSQLLNQGKTFEGAIAANSINKLAKSLAIKLILCETIAEILNNNFSLEEIKAKIIKAIINHD